VLSIFLVLGDWEETLWPNETQLASHLEKRIESAQIREVALTLASSELQPFLAPWWLSLSIAYWSKQPGVAGSSHESLKEIEDSARFFLSNDLKQTRAILHKNNVAWAFAYDSQRVTQNSAAVLSEAVPADPLCRVLDRTPGPGTTASDFFGSNAGVQALPGEYRKVKRKNFSLRKENPLTGIDECHITTRCSRDSSLKGRRPRFEKNHGLRFQMTTIILRVAKSQHQNQP